MMTSYDSTNSPQKPRSELIPVYVPDTDALMATQLDGTIWVALKPMCDALGIDHEAQRKRLNRRSWATTSIMEAVATDGKMREMTMIDAATVPMWLATINEDRVKPSARHKLIAYQHEAARVLYEHFFTTDTKIDELNAIIALLKEEVSFLTSDFRSALKAVNSTHRSRSAHIQRRR